MLGSFSDLVGQEIEGSHIIYCFLWTGIENLEMKERNIRYPYSLTPPCPTSIVELPEAKFSEGITAEDRCNGKGVPFFGREP
jgi:hypothetical protein